MRRASWTLLLALAFAGPAWSQASIPCSPTLHFPIFYHVAEPVCAGKPLNLVAEACGPCFDLVSWTQMPPGPVQINATMTANACILTVCMRDSLVIPIGTYAAGNYVMLVQVAGTVIHPDSTFCYVTQTDTVRFTVAAGCGGPTPLPYVRTIRIGPPPACDSCPPPPICPGDSIPITIAGYLPNNCWVFRGLELLPSPIVGPMPEPPIARITVSRDECAPRICLLYTVAFSATAMMPPLPSRDYSMIVQVREVIMCDSAPARETTYSQVEPFSVVASCPPPATGCFLYQWHGAASTPGCTALVGAGTPARLTFDVATGVPLAGLQGRLAFDTAGLAITGLRAVGPARGMHLTWQPLADGASFVLFADHSAPIRSPAACATCPAAAVPVLEVTVSQSNATAAAAVTKLFPVSLAASDSLGRSVGVCPTFAEIPPATICAASSCDFNGDGQTDVRDLVLMMRCIRGSGPCPDSAAARFDCNRDGRLGLEDVWCCGLRIIRNRMPQGCPTRPVPGVSVVAGAPVATATGIDVPVRVLNAAELGAARLAFAYATEDFSGATATIPGDDGSWILLADGDGGELLVGLVANAPPTPGVADLDLVLHFTLASGRTASSVTADSPEFAATDGVAILNPDEPVAVPLAGAPPIRLSAARPNPFTHETQFVLTLTRAARTDLSVFDLGGRRIATLHHGELAAGSHPFAWDGRADRGDRVRDGVYLLRAEGAGVSTTRKLVQLRGQ